MSAVETFTLSILPDQRTLRVPAHAHLHEVLDQHGISLTAHCDGMGLCGKCRVRIMCCDGNPPPPTPADQRLLSHAELATGVRLACMWRVCCNAQVEILPSSRLANLRVLTDSSITEAPCERPALAYPFGIAIDIGTTTVVGTLMDVRTGIARAVAARVNAQRIYGADIISRVNHALRNGGASQLHRALVNTINEIIAALVSEAQTSLDQIGEIVLTGNVVMLHSLHQASLRSLAALPFKPAFVEARSLPAHELELHLPPHVRAYSFPLVDGFVGGDTVACMLATSMDEAPEYQMVIDIGTNGEIALGCARGWFVASAPAGPAFEGARISCGMPAADGAIAHFSIFPDHLELDVIGEQTPRGICGSGLIDVAAALLDYGLLDSSGRLRGPSELSDCVPPWLRARIVVCDGQPSFLLFDPARDTYHNSVPHPRPLYLTQRDFRELQLAKAAIATACELVLHAAGLALDDLATLYLAGAFGNYLRPLTARRIGLLPNIPLEKIKFIGNAASTGARLALLSPQFRARAETIARHARHVDLAALPEFQASYTQHMFFPDNPLE